MITRYDIYVLCLFQLCIVFTSQMLWVIFAKVTYATEDEYLSATANNVTGSFFKYDSTKQYYSPCMEFKILKDDQFLTSYYKMSFIQMKGVFLGCLLASLSIDRFGRTPVVKIAFGAGAALLAVSGFSPNMAVFLVLRFFIGMSVGSSLVSVWALASELLNPECRLISRTLFNFANARLLMIFVSWSTRTWRLSMFIYSAINIVIVIGLHFIAPESPIWLAMKGRHKEAREAAEYIYLLSGRTHTIVLPEENSVEEKVSLRTVLSTPSLRCSFIVLAIMWFSTSFSAYSVDLTHTDIIKDDLFLTQFVQTGVLAVFKLTLGVFSLYTDKIDSRNYHITSLSVNIVFTTISVALMLCDINKSLDYRIFFIIPYLISYASLEFLWDCCYMSIVEVMPTAVRGSTSGACSIIARIGTIAATAMENLPNIFEPSVLISVLLVSTANLFIAKLFLKNTKRVQLGMVIAPQKENIVIAFEGKSNTNVLQSPMHTNSTRKDSIY